MKTKLFKLALIVFGGINFFANSTFAEDAITNSVIQTNSQSPFIIIVSPKKARVHIKEIFKVGLEVKNISNTNQSFTVMSCSWQDHWESNNRQIKAWIFRVCAANAPIKVELAPDESWEKELEMCIPAPVSTNKISFKMSFTPLPLYFASPHIENWQIIEPEKRETKIYWSDEVSVNINPKWIPDWISW